MSDLCSEVNSFGKAFSNRTRYRIIEALLRGRKTVGELVRIVKLSQPAVSQHLKVLKSYKIVIDERRGQEIFYTVNTEYVLYLLKCMISDMNRRNKSRNG
ncbi:MAG: metalloregulator ArsR/SmtB family transcription factor [Patescibacteria group bacterium]|nr:metalloregulator ArsR/SmtB family transcription factor [Patescibacteria group bacterium]MCL5224313.1 metalloregulator ArsR/SmtB family transcription factor [Patescibacteria group bacterium]